MESMSLKSIHRQRRFFKFLNRYMILHWRLGLGAWGNRPDLGGNIMVIVHTGRKTGLQRQTPVNYALVEGEIYCMAGFGQHSDWHHNLLACPEVEVWLPDGWWQGIAEVVKDPEKRISFGRAVLMGSGPAARLYGLNPAKMNDEETARAIEGATLFHIRRTAARTGPGGPGDLAWIWPVATFVLLLKLLQRNRRRRR